MVNRADRYEGLATCRRTLNNAFKGNTSIDCGPATIEKTRCVFRDFPTTGANPEDARASSTLFSRAFIPPCILEIKDCLSRTSHPPKQAGTLDAHFNHCRANAVPGASCLSRLRGFPGKHSVSAFAPRHALRFVSAAGRPYRPTGAQLFIAAPSFRAWPQRLLSMSFQRNVVSDRRTVSVRCLGVVAHLVKHQ